MLFMATIGDDQRRFYWTRLINYAPLLSIPDSLIIAPCSESIINIPNTFHCQA